MDRLEFEAKLSMVYNGAVTPVTRYTNERATVLFRCEKCGTEFFNKAGHMLGKDYQKHICTLPYGDSFGTRLNNMGNSKITPKKRKEEETPDKVAKQLYEMIVVGYTPYQIAKELKVNRRLIEDHFKAKGLI